MIRVMSDLAPAVSAVVRRCLGVGAGEDVLVIVDEGTREIGEALRAEASAAGADAVLGVMDERATDGTEPARPLAAALSACDVFIAPTSRSLSHTLARKRASENGARGATMPGVTADMLARVMGVEFDTMTARSRTAAALLDGAGSAHVRCPRGSDLTLDLTGRAGLADDGDLSARGAFGNLPCGEAFIAPLSGEGQIMAVSLAPLGLSAEPATLVVEQGRIVDARGGLGPEYLELLRAHGELGTNLAELGIGTNDRATLTGLVLEDEKILGTVHVAFGASAGIGGTVSVPIHLDVVITDASLEIDGQAVLDQGRWVLDPVSPLLAVPNISEGRRTEVIEAIGLAFGVPLLDVHSDPDHHRSVFTFAGGPGELAEATLNGVREAVARIDLRRQAGAHPRVGAIDVAPIVYLQDSDRGAACAEALVLADGLGEQLELPVLLYGVLAGGRTRASLRRGGPGALAERLADGGLRPDYGPARLHPTAGAVLVAARPPLVAFNVELAPGVTEREAVAIAAQIREGGEDGLPGVRAIGLWLEHKNVAQVSTNVEDHRGASLAQVVTAIERRASIGETELVGLAPKAAFDGFPEDVVVRNRRLIEDVVT